jgi:galactose mutarotase-like enzyme
VATVVTQSVEGARIEIDLDAGCRLASLEVDGHQLLVTSAPSPIDWGGYPMAPYAGRVREGRFAFRGRSYELPQTLGGHAIHGSVYLHRWEAENDSAFVTELGPEWPFAGWARHVMRLDADRVSLRLEVHSESGAMPASCGWHPWFRRAVAGVEAVLDFHPGFMYERDDAGVATRTRRPVSEGPWDDCFGDVYRAPAITWPGVLRLELESTCESWVVFTERDHALCVEPLTAPPDALNHDPFVVEPERPLVAECTMRWSRPDIPAGRAAGRIRD